jgi:hypothetical protein
MEKQLRYFAYVSRAKVDQLHDQLTDFQVTSKSVKKGKEGDASAEAGANALFGFIKGGLKVGARSRMDVEETGAQSTVQRLVKVLEHVGKSEKVLDLAQICTRKQGVKLDAFCYTYSGKFFALANIGRKSERYGSGIHFPEEAIERSGDEIVISKKLLVEPGRQENDFPEKGPNNSRLVSDMCILTSHVSDYVLNLACSLKYFSDMGGSYDEKAGEWDVYPHSGNHHFFAGGCDSWFEAVLFLNGIQGKTIMGTPLCLLHSIDPNLTI